MGRKRFDSIWDAIESPRATASIKVRATLMRTISDELKQQNLSLLTASKLTGLSKRKTSMLRRGSIDALDVDTVLAIARTLGSSVDFEISGNR